MSNICILGAGLTGLSAAYKLKKEGHKVTLLENTDRIGGVIQTLHREGYHIELGPHTFFLKDLQIKNFFDEIGLSSQISYPTGNEKTRYIIKNGKVTQTPNSLLSFLSTKAFSSKAKLRLLKEFFTTKSSKNESVAEFGKRHFGQEIVDYGIEPFVSGIYAGDAYKLSLKHAFPQLYALEQASGSIIKAIFKAPKSLVRKQVISFQDGMTSLPKTIAKHLENEIHLNTQITKITKINNKWEITSNNNTKIYDHLIITIPAHALNKLPFDTPITIGQSVIYEPIALISLAFETQHIKKPFSGFGFLVPPKENLPILGAITPSSIFNGRAPKNFTLFTVFQGGARNHNILKQSETELFEIATKTLQKLLKIEGAPVFKYLKIWNPGIPQYNLGYEEVLKNFAELEQKYQNLHFLGNYLNGVSLPDCIKSGLNFKI